MIHYDFTSRPVLRTRSYATSITCRSNDTPGISVKGKRENISLQVSSHLADFLMKILYLSIDRRNFLMKILFLSIDRRNLTPSIFLHLGKLGRTIPLNTCKEYIILIHHGKDKLFVHDVFEWSLLQISFFILDGIQLVKNSLVFLKMLIVGIFRKRSDMVFRNTTNGITYIAYCRI